MSQQQDQNPGEETQTRNPGMEVMADQSDDNEVQSALHMEEGEQPRVNTFPSFSRPSSFYTLALDEFQNTLTGTGRNYGSMNMNEFLQSIWTVEENEAQAQNANIPMPAVAPMTTVTDISPQNQFCETSNERPRQLSLTRQESVSVPASLCQRTVEEVWSEINRTQQITNNFTHAGSKQSDPAHGEMTLVDFLVRAGVVREESAGRTQPPPPSPPPPQLPQLQPQPQSELPYGMYVNCDSTAAPSFMILGTGGTGSVNVPPPFKVPPQIDGANVAVCLLGGKSSASAYQPANSYGGGVTDINGCGTERLEQMSSVSSDGIGMSKPRKKRNRDGLMERVFERRENRKIKNRVAAARSRAKKHAYTIELEEKLNHLKEENAYLRHRLNSEAPKASAQANGKCKLGQLRRCISSPF